MTPFKQKLTKMETKLTCSWLDIGTEIIKSNINEEATEMHTNTCFFCNMHYAAYFTY